MEREFSVAQIARRHFLLIGFCETPRAESRHSLRLQTQLGNMMKAGTRGSDKFFRCADAANGGEPKIQDAAAWTKVRFFQLRLISMQPFNDLFEKASFLLGLMLINKTAHFQLRV
jgi:hypothetical protein